MQSYEGYYENGHFFPIGKTLTIKERRRAIIILDEPAHDETITKRIAVLEEFFEAIDADDEEVPEFERVNFARDVEL